MGSESTSNSMKFHPLRLAELMANLKSMAESPDTSYSSGEESESSPIPSPSKTSLLVSSKSPPTRVPSRAQSTPYDSSRKQGDDKENNPFTHLAVTHPSEKKINIKDSKDNGQIKPEVQKVSCTYLGQGCGDRSCPPLPHYPASEVKRRNVLSSQHNGALRMIQSATKCTPDFGQHNPKPRSSTPITKPKSSTPITKPLINGLKSTPVVKTTTPAIKSGIKKFTPGSGKRHSNKKDGIRKAVTPSKESARCLFPEPQRRSVDPPQADSLPETPLNKGTLAVASTPSYPNTNSSKITLKSIVIKGKSYMFIKKLGAGGSSEVFKVLEVGGECGEYAVKCVNMAVDRNMAQSYINEIRLLRELQSSDRVIQLYAYEYDKASQSLKVVLEVGETDLSSFLKARQATGLPSALILYYWEEMLHAVNHIHQHGVVHADLKPANFLLVCGRLKLIDFGIASRISTDATSVERQCAAGTFSYISPEALMGGAGRYESANMANKEAAPIKISFRSDVWSLGCILYSMVYGYTPFGHISSVFAKITAVVDPNHVINYPAVENIPPNLMLAMKWCLTYNAKSRPSVKQLLSIEYLSGTNQTLPPHLLAKLQPHLSPDEFALLQKARI